MGWKSLKDYYGITKLVKIENEIFYIGSAYVPEVLGFDKNGTQVKFNDVFQGSPDFIKYEADILKDPAKFKELYESTDKFEKSLPVYTYQGTSILEFFCENYGYPNLTHDGQMMYDNQFSADRSQVVKWAKEYAKLKAVHAQRMLQEAQEKVLAYSKELSLAQAEISWLDSNE